MNRFFLKFLDNFIYNYLAKNVDKMPMRFVKFIGSYYTDARIRKLYLKRLGLEMGDGTFANPELNVITDHPERKANGKFSLSKKKRIPPYNK